MGFRRIAALAVAGVLALAPTASHGLGEEAAPVPRTNCVVGYETFEYDAAAFDWKASSTMQCTSGYQQLVLRVSVVLVQAMGNALTIPESMIYCIECSGLQHRVNRTSPYITNGIYQVRSGARVIGEHADIVAEHFSCFLVRDVEAKPLMAGCPKIR